MKQIPCKQCPVLAMCKNKDIVKCKILAKIYMRMPYSTIEGCAYNQKDNNIFMNNVTQYLGFKDWVIYGIDDARLYRYSATQNLFEKD